MWPDGAVELFTGLLASGKSGALGGCKFGAEVVHEFMGCIVCVLNSFMVFVADGDHQHIICKDARLDLHRLHEDNPRSEEERDDEHGERAPLWDAARPRVRLAESSTDNVADSKVANLVAVGAHDSRWAACHPEEHVDQDGLDLVKAFF